MNKLLHFKTLVFLVFLVTTGTVFGQEVSGTVTDGSEPIPGVSVIVKGTTNGTTTDFDGNYTISANNGDILVFSYVGFETQEVTVTGSVLNITMKSGVALDAVVLTGNRSKPRTILDSPVPIDNIGVEQLKTSGQATIENMLTFTVPSFNSQNQAISDATAHYDPADLRGLGPSRTLVLINGKRKNQSAQVFLNRTTW